MSLQAALNAQRHGRLEEAEQLYLKILETIRSNRMPIICWSNRFAKEDFDKAIPLIERAVEIAPTSAVYTGNLELFIARRAG